MVLHAFSSFLMGEKDKKDGKKGKEASQRGSSEALTVCPTEQITIGLLVGWPSYLETLRTTRDIYTQHLSLIIFFIRIESRFRNFTLGE